MYNISCCNTLLLAQLLWQPCHSLSRYNAGLAAGVQDISFEFTATSDTFGCTSDDPCPGTYGMKLSVCELECEDTKHEGHAGSLVAAACVTAHTFFHYSALQSSTSMTPSLSPSPKIRERRPISKEISSRISICLFTAIERVCLNKLSCFIQDINNNVHSPPASFCPLSTAATLMVSAPK